MRQIPFERLLIQPQVHRDWLRRAGALRFELDDATAAGFAELWRAFEARHRPAPADFLNDHSLVENDALFALFAALVLLLQDEPELSVTPGERSLILSRANG